MWLVTGVDEESRFPEWPAAADFYREIVRSWVATHGAPGVDEPVIDLSQGGSHQIAFESPDGGKVEFELAWEIPGGGWDQMTAC